MFRSTLEAGAGTAGAAVRAAAAEINPPSGYEADFAAFNDYLAATVDADVRYAAAAEAKDLVALALAQRGSDVR